MKKLTKSQQKIYDYLLERKESIPPTVREICEATGFKSTSSVHAHLATLERLGYITRQAGLTRTILIKGKEESAVHGVSVPVIGTVTAGQPIFAFEEALGYITIDESVARGRELFALKISGESMVNAGIFDGDTVVFVRQPVAENGDIVVALIDDEATVKRFFKEDRHYRLQPENPDFEPIILDSVEILGKVVTLIRNYD